MSKPLILSGYALYWDERARIYDDKGWFYEQFNPGAFKESLHLKNQAARLFHKKVYDFAFADKGQLLLLEDDLGLAFRIELPNDSEGRLIYNCVKNKEIAHVSVGFNNACSEERFIGGRRIITIAKANLVEISLLNNPAYKTSFVQVGCSNRRLNMLSEITHHLMKY